MAKLRGNRFVDNRLPDGTSHKSWERPLKFTKTYFVDCNDTHADDSGPGSQAKPFESISAAAALLQPGERVVIAEGLYRESVCPARGGEGPSRMISYEAAPGAKVVVSGSIVLDKGWTNSVGWRRGPGRGVVPVGDARIWQIRLDGAKFAGYNPFALVNVLQDRFWLAHKKIQMSPFFMRRGMLFVDGQPLKQVELFTQLLGGAGRFWIEHNGMTLHVRLPDDGEVAGKLIEATAKEQVFAPRQMHLGYIRVKGMTLQHASSGYPVPQRGLLSTSRGNHWIVEDCTIAWANSVGLDCGNECWNAERAKALGYHILRRNTVRDCGICGVAGLHTHDMLVEDNLIERVGFGNGELAYESAGLKFHGAKSMMFRRNIVRHLEHACGIWLDCSDENCRLAGNVFANISTISGAIHFEGNHGPNMVDNNIVIGSRSEFNEDGGPSGGKGIYEQGTDKLIVAHNLVANCQEMGFRADIVPVRIIDGRGGTAAKNAALNNVFIRCGSGVEWENDDNTCDGNVYSQMPPGFLRVEKPPFPQRLDLATWQELRGWDKHGAMADLEVQFDADKLTLKVSERGKTPGASALGAMPTPPLGGHVRAGAKKLPRVKPPKQITTDFTGQSIKGPRTAGPFADLIGEHDVDPRM